MMAWFDTTEIAVLIPFDVYACPKKMLSNILVLALVNLWRSFIQYQIFCVTMIFNLSIEK